MMEDHVHNAADKKLYTDISYARKGMIAGQNSVGTTIASDRLAIDMSALIYGTRQPASRRQ
jgi:hypothetical protein